MHVKCIYLSFPLSLYLLADWWGFLVRLLTIWKGHIYTLWRAVVVQLYVEEKTILMASFYPRYNL